MFSSICHLDFSPRVTLEAPHLKPITDEPYPPKVAMVSGGASTGGSAGGPGDAIDSLADIGTHLRAARLARGITLREMSRRVGISPSFVSQVELGKAKPSLGTLYGFLSELDLSLDELMFTSGPHSETKPIPKVAPTSLPNLLGGVEFDPMWANEEYASQIWSEHPLIQMKGVTWRRLTSDDPMVDFLHVTYEPGSESCPMDHLMRHEGHEYGHIISGHLRVQVGFETYEMQPGDAINFPSTTPHRLYNVGSVACTSIWVVVGRRAVNRSE
jgi:transcriptional regulator with XRE-family HTH domain/quercetin dioxygenase-like cupin family protein